MTTKEEILALAGECGIQNDYISEDQAVEAFYYAARKPLEEEIERLSERRCEVCGYAEHHREHTGCLRQQLAAAQAREQQYREALMKVSVHIRPTCDELYYECKAILMPPPDTSALEAMIKKAVEVMRERCIAVSCDNPDGFVGGSIRALPGVTLADLKGAE